MDTSDSEHFESADEDLHSDDEQLEDTQNVQKKFIESPKHTTNQILETSTNQRSDDENVKNESSETGHVHKLTINKLEIDNNAEETVANAGTIDKINEQSTSSVNSGKKQVEQKEKETIKSADSKKCRVIKSKLGSKIAKDAVHFDSTPKKEATDKKKVEETERICEPKADLWDEDELDWGAEGKIESDQRQEYIQVQNKTKAKSMNFPNEPESEIQSSSDGWGGWGTWGVSVLSSAGQSVSSITSQLTNVIESGLGAVDPEELAKLDIETKKKTIDWDEKIESETSEGDSGVFGLGSLVKLVENTGTKVISGGLDTLETIGKKTMEVLQEGDPGLKKKRAFLKIEKDKPVLSQILREAKERAENNSTNTEETHKKTKNYLTLLDDYQGLVHLEALELLSKQCEIKLKNMQNSLTGTHHTKFTEKMDKIKELCELKDDDEEPDQHSQFQEILKNAAIEMEVEISYEKLMNHWEETEIWLNVLNIELCDEIELHQKAIETLAQVTSMAMEQFHKFAELTLIKDKRKAANEAINVTLIASTLISLAGLIADKFAEKLNLKTPQCKEKEMNELITNVFFETATTTGNIEDALQLLIPIIQLGEVQNNLSQ